MSSCSKKDSDAPIPDNDPTGDYLYSSQSKSYSADGELEHDGISEGAMYVSWYTGSTTMSIQISPNIGYSYTIKGSNLEVHGDTTTFRISSQVVKINETSFNLRGNNDINVPGIGKYDGYFVKNKKIIYAFKSSNIEDYETTETRTEGYYRN